MHPLKYIQPAATSFNSAIYQLSRTVAPDDCSFYTASADELLTDRRCQIDHSCMKKQGQPC
uniref:Uncharacterized protein n=1 Tax=Anguilla anguilla TaxID=7936 RepID=A0A0E9W9D7_ANGAN